ncbi:hypothetical protein AMR72_01020 [Flavobacterium psychrophilum]|nr:hypothetical protein AMR72_01020 [Flavobacterium psychrophilum]AOE51226.1 hypothetical protein ALW18_01020 [Flavobacterium psychrophilum]
MKTEDFQKKVNSRDANISKTILFSSILFGLYAFYLLIETLDFLALLHSKEPDYSPTYTIVHVAYIIVEMIVCMGLAIWIYIIYLSNVNKNLVLGIIFTAIAFFRIIMVYYLYHYSEPQYHFVPYIYKLANPLSNLFRFSFIYLQIFAVAVCAIKSFRANRNRTPN